LDALIQIFFCAPAARVAASFLGASCAPAEEGFRIFSCPAVHVTAACSGVSYFFIVMAVLLFSVVQFRRWRFLLGVVPAAYAVTLVANSARIVCGWHTRILAERFLSERWYNLVHLGTGMVCFLTFLFTIHILIQRRWAHDSKIAAS
jgi:exosortase/archaeosortase family protein